MNLFIHLLLLLCYSQSVKVCFCILHMGEEIKKPSQLTQNISTQRNGDPYLFIENRLILTRATLLPR